MELVAKVLMLYVRLNISHVSWAINSVSDKVKCFIELSNQDKKYMFNLIASEINYILGL